MWLKIKAFFSAIKGYLITFGAGAVAVIAFVLYEWWRCRDDQRNTVPPGRVDDAGTPIPIGTPDAGGFTQGNSGDLGTSGGHVVTDGTRIDTPTGVKPSTVASVATVTSEVTVTGVVDKTGVNAADLLNSLGVK
jgi:hypothetical protein